MILNETIIANRLNNLDLNTNQIIWDCPKNIEWAEVAALIQAVVRQKSGLDRLSQRF